jgi:4-amino-4-deoxy-L-arabinose transferase-like glycosyltransferase
MRGVRVALIAAAALLVGITVYAVAGRLTYPFELEWMEGEMAVHVMRLLRGEPLYGEPTIAFVPFGYPPLYYYVALLLAWLAGPGLLPLRLVSIAATVVTMLTIGAIVRRESGWVAAIASSAAFAGAYAASDAWFDLGRVDALYVAFLALSYRAAVRAAAPSGWIGAGALAALAFLTKQPALIAFAPFVAYLIFTDRRAALWWVGSFVLLAGSVTAALWILSDGWYWYYVFDLPRLRLAVSPRSGRLLSFWKSDLLPFAIALTAGTIVAISQRAWRHLALASGLVLSAWMSRLEGGAWNNTVIPAYLAAAVMTGLLLRRGVSRPLLGHALAVVQLLVLAYDPRPFMPTARHQIDGELLLQSLQALPKPVLILDHGYWATRAGLEEHAHGWAVTDVVWADTSSVGSALQAEVRQAIATRRFGAIVLDDEQSWFFADIERHYRRTGELISPAPLSGAARQPSVVYERRPGG